jgi:site-specific recombinase XerD
MSIEKKILSSYVIPKSRDLTKEWYIKYRYLHHITIHTKKQRIPSNLPSVKSRLLWAENFIKNWNDDINKVVEDVANKHIALLFNALGCKRIKDKTRSTYKGHIRGLSKYCADNQIKNITVSVAYDFIDSLRGQLEGRTINHYKRTLSELYQGLVKKGLVKNDPFSDIEREKVKKAFSESWSDEHIRMIVEHAKVFKPQLLLPISIMLHCATRNGVEMPNIKVKDVDLKRQLIWIDDVFAKNKERESIKIPNSLYQILVQYKVDSYPPQCFLMGRNGKPSIERIGRNYLNRHFKEITELLGIDKKGKGFYRLKNSLGGKMVRNNVNKFAIQKQFRHKSFATTEKYLQSITVEDFPELLDLDFFKM